MEKRAIKIAGAGLSGLTAAINLAKAGYKVRIYEKTLRIGGHYRENPQLLPNWFSEKDVLEELGGCNININWVNEIREIEICLPNQKIIFYGNKMPIGYTVLRGGENSLENHLFKQAKESGVEVITDYSLDKNSMRREKIDIVATGLSESLTIGYGQVYTGDFNSYKAKVFFDPKYTPGIGYGYFFPHSNERATVKISRTIRETKINLKERLDALKKDFLSEEIKKENFLYDFATLRSFKIPNSAIQDSSFLIGEAAGFQDELFRFGMRYAILSGYLAAKAIVENLNYDTLWKERFSNELRRTRKVRKIFEGLKKKGFNAFRGEEIYIDIETFKKLWLSRKFYFLLNLYPFCQNLIFNRGVFNLFSKMLFRLKILRKSPEEF